MSTIVAPEAIQEAIRANPELNDQQLGRLLGIRRYSRVRQVREAMATDALPSPPSAAMVETPDPRLVCHCGFVAKTPPGLAVHQQRRHPPVAIIAPDVPVATDEPPVRPSVEVRPTICCANCGREGTPASSRPEWCAACAASPELARVRASWKDSEFRCGCNRHFARSTKDPSRCIKCTGEYDQIYRTRHPYALLAR